MSYFKKIKQALSKIGLEIQVISLKEVNIPGNVPKITFCVSGIIPTADESAVEKTKVGCQ